MRFVIYVFCKIMLNMERSLVTKYTRNMYRVKYYHEESLVTHFRVQCVGADYPPTIFIPRNDKFSMTLTWFLLFPENDEKIQMKFLETHETPKVLDTETDSSSDSSFVEVSEINNMNRGKSGKGHWFESLKYHFLLRWEGCGFEANSLLLILNKFWSKLTIFRSFEYYIFSWMPVFVDFYGV